MCWKFDFHHLFKKFIIFFIAILLVGFGQVRFLDEYFKVGQELELHVNVINDKYYDLEEFRVKVDIPGLTYMISHSFDLDDNDNHGLFFYYRIPYNTKKGDYLVKITASNDDFTDTEYRYITIV